MDCEKLDEDALNLAEQIRLAGLNRGYFVSLINSQGAKKGFRKLMESGFAQPGFVSLMEKGLVELTAEYFVLSPQYDECFEEEVKAAAEFRLINWQILARSLGD